jgi:hypothetical protein
MITIAMAAVIDASQSRTWRALTSPDERIAWDERIIGAVDAPDEYPVCGQHLRWRYRLGTVQVIMHERPVEVCDGERLRANLQIGSMRLEQTFSLHPEPESTTTTRLGMRVVASNSIALVGGTVDRFDVRQMASSHIDETLRALQKWCVDHP